MRLLVRRVFFDRTDRFDRFDRLDRLPPWFLFAATSFATSFAIATSFAAAFATAFGIIGPPYSSHFTI